MRKTTKDQDAILNKLMAQGWRQKETKKGLLLMSPNGKTIVAVHGSPSDHRSLRNIIAKCREGGADL